MLVEFHRHVMCQVLLHVLGAIHWGWVYNEDLVWSLISDEQCCVGGADLTALWLRYFCSQPQAL